MSRVKSLLLGVFVGGVVSATATLFSAPASGRDTRLKIKDQATEWKELLEGLKRDGLKLKDQLAKTSKESSALIKDLTREMKSSVIAWKESVEPHQENIKDYLEQIEVSLKELEEKVKKSKK